MASNTPKQVVKECDDCGMMSEMFEDDTQCADCELEDLLCKCCKKAPRVEGRSYCEDCIDDARDGK